MVAVASNQNIRLTPEIIPHHHEMHENHDTIKPLNERQNMKNKINHKLKEWVREVHGRRAALALHCGISGGTVDSWLHERCGIAKRHHAKILAFTGVCATVGVAE